MSEINYYICLDFLSYPCLDSWLAYCISQQIITTFLCYSTSSANNLAFPNPLIIHKYQAIIILLIFLSRFFTFHCLTLLVRMLYKAALYYPPLSTETVCCFLFNQLSCHPLTDSWSQLVKCPTSHQTHSSQLFIY